MPETVESLAKLLATLREHGVQKFSRGGFSVEFAPGQSPAEARALLGEIEQSLTRAPSPAASSVEPRTEPMRIDLEDVLPGGVQ